MSVRLCDVVWRDRYRGPPATAGGSDECGRGKQGMYSPIRIRVMVRGRG